MLPQARQEREQPGGEVGETVRGPVLEGAEVELDPHHRRRTVQVRPAVDRSLDHAHRTRPFCEGAAGIVHPRDVL